MAVAVRYSKSIAEVRNCRTDASIAREIRSAIALLKLRICEDARAIGTPHNHFDNEALIDECLNGRSRLHKCLIRRECRGQY